MVEEGRVKEGGEEEMGEGRRLVGGEGGVCGENESKQQRSSGKWEIQCRGRGEGETDYC